MDNLETEEYVGLCKLNGYRNFQSSIELDHDLAATVNVRMLKKMIDDSFLSVLSVVELIPVPYTPNEQVLLERVERWDKDNAEFGKDKLKNFEIELCDFLENSCVRPSSDFDAAAKSVFSDEETLPNDGDVWAKNTLIEMKQKRSPDQKVLGERYIKWYQKRVKKEEELYDTVEF